MVFNILALISTITVIALLRRLVYIFTLLVACLARWKESINLEASVKNSSDRNLIALAMVIPFCLVAEKFSLYNPSFMDGMGEDLRIGVTVGVFVLYDAVRRLAYLMMMTNNQNRKVYGIANKSSYSFFIILTIILLATGSIMSFIKIDAEIIRIAMLWISASIYALSLLRKMQIFVSGFSILTSFLYLCALEIIPTGLLMASVLIF